MRILLIFLFIFNVSACAHHSYEGPKKEKDQVAKVFNNADAVLILAVNGKKPPKKLLYEKEYNAYLNPGVTRFKIKHSYTQYIPIPGGGLVGLASSSQNIEDICFNLEAGETYWISSNINKGTPIVEKKVSLGKYTPVQLLSCE